MATVVVRQLGAFFPPECEHGLDLPAIALAVEFDMHLGDVRRRECIENDALIAFAEFCPSLAMTFELAHYGIWIVHDGLLSWLLVRGDKAGRTSRAVTAGKRATRILGAGSSLTVRC